MLDGIINLHKPPGITSAKALYRVRGSTGQRKSGHAGTLDPAATGVLVLCLGQATKLVEQIMNQPKAYRATARLDVTSESFDADRPLIPFQVSRTPSLDDIRQTLASMIGEVDQVPPAISALKIGGRPAYRLARAGQLLNLSPRRIRIDSITLQKYEWPNVEFEVCCGRGTYIRAIIRDLGVQCGTGGCLTSLSRLRVGPFAIEQGWSLDALQKAVPDEYLIPLDAAREMLTLAPKR